MHGLPVLSLAVIVILTVTTTSVSGQNGDIKIFETGRYVSNTWAKKKDKAEEALFGVTSGFVTCLNVACHPAKFIKEAAENIVWFERVFRKLIIGISRLQNGLIAFKNTPILKVVIQVIDRILTAVVRVLDKGADAIERIEPKLNKTAEVLGKVVNGCYAVKFMAVWINGNVQIFDRLEGTNRIEELTVTSDQWNKTCYTVLGPFDAATGWMDKVTLVRKIHTKDRTGVLKIRRKRSDLEYSVYDPSGQLAITITAEAIANQLQDVRDSISFIEPALDIMEKVQSVIDDILNTEICMPVGPFGIALKAALQLTGEAVDIVMNTATAIAEGRLGDAAKSLLGVFGAVGDVFDSVLDDIGETLEDILPGPLGSFVGDAFDVVGDVGSAVGGVVEDAGRGVVDFIGGLFGGRRRRDVSYSWGQEMVLKRRLHLYLSQSQRHRASLHSKIRRRRDVDLGGLTADQITRLGDFITPRGICITPKMVLDGLSFLLDTILKPINDLIDFMLKPLTDELEKLFGKFLPDLEFLDGLDPILDAFDPLSFPNPLAFTQNLVDPITKHPLVSQLQAVAASQQLNSGCIDAVNGYLDIDVDVSLEQVKCACIVNCGAGSDPPPNVPSLPPVAPPPMTTASLPECIDASDPQGVNYKGTQSIPVQGLECLPWIDQIDVTDADIPDATKADAQNYCRNAQIAFTQQPSPWCFVMLGGIRSVIRCAGIPACGALVDVPPPAPEPTPPPQECRTTPNGQDYRGFKAVTATGVPCLPWTTSFFGGGDFADGDFPDGSKAAASNYCRNPKLSASVPSCIVMKSVNFGFFTNNNINLPVMEACDVPMCDEGCRENILGTEYDGIVAKTISGRQCQKWVVLHPHSHSLTGDNFPHDQNSLALANNFCRNPDNRPGGPWCYTTDPSVPWEYCPVEMCDAGLVHVPGSLRLNSWDFHDDLLDPTSDLFKLRSQELTDELFNGGFFDDLMRPFDFTVLGFRFGSVICDFVVSFKKQDNETDEDIVKAKKRVAEDLNEKLLDKKFLKKHRD